MGFYYYRRYYFSNPVQNRWDGLQIAKDAEHHGILNDHYDGEWVKEVESSGWIKGFRKQLLGE